MDCSMPRLPFWQAGNDAPLIKGGRMATHLQHAAEKTTKNSKKEAVWKVWSGGTVIANIVRQSPANKRIA